MAKYRLLLGKHTEKSKVDAKGKAFGEDKEGNPILRDKAMQAGDTVETDLDLCAIWNKGEEVRFEKVGD